MQEEKTYSVFVVSDATGKTASGIVRSILVQFKEMVDHFFITHYSFVREKGKIDKIVERAKEQEALIIHTFAEDELREYFNYQLQAGNVRFIDVFQNIIPAFTEFIGISPAHHTGQQYKLNEEYFKKIEAMEFTIAHDDGQNLFDIQNADIIIIGPSRTSKTPLSIYMANEGYRVANIPLVYGIPIPRELKEVNPKKVIALMIQFDIMQEIRKQRVNYLGRHASDYASPEYIFRELEYCRDLYKQNRQWRVIDVSKKAIEETATEIIEKIMGGEEVF
jgi:regulator of PEP synthase PpsR (kinase-PPPase family)